MLKKELRKLYKEKRKSISAPERNRFDDLMLIHFQQLALGIPAHIMTYEPMEKMAEFDPYVIMDYCNFQHPGCIFIYPVIEGDQLVTVKTDADTAFHENQWGIYEPVNGEIIDPKEIELILLPMLVGDKKGHRVGYGKGYYDRLLSNCSPNVTTVGLSYFEPIDKIDDVLPTDITMDFLVTPYGSHCFK